jgi:predicted transglutaminase-like cysteine proteinase
MGSFLPMTPPHGGGRARLPTWRAMKATIHPPAAAAVAAAAGLLAACLAPVENAVDAPYREPRGNAAAYRGLLNETQQSHLRTATFPKLTGNERRLLRRINADVNHDLRYLTDVENYAVPDLPVTEPPVHRPALAHLPPARYGDCEDYALTKKQRLARAGFSPSRTFIATASVPENGYRIIHSALAVPEGGDWWILNNWDNQIQRASSLERWWEWEFVRPRYDTYLLSMQMRRIAGPDDDSLPAAGGGHRGGR